MSATPPTPPPFRPLRDSDARWLSWIVAGCIGAAIGFAIGYNVAPRANSGSREISSDGTLIVDQSSTASASNERRTVAEKYGYDVGQLPWERDAPQWSWYNEAPFTVLPPRNLSTHYKSGFLVEHRVVELHYPQSRDRRAISEAATEVWRHFAAEVERRHPQAQYKRVHVTIWIDGQPYPEFAAGVATNEASPNLPSEPEIRWIESNWEEKPPLSESERHGGARSAAVYLRSGYMPSHSEGRKGRPVEPMDVLQPLAEHTKIVAGMAEDHERRLRLLEMKVRGQ